MRLAPIQVFTARFPIGYHFTVRPFAVTSWTIPGTNVGILKSIFYSGLAPQKVFDLCRPFYFTLFYCKFSGAHGKTNCFQNGR